MSERAVPHVRKFLGQRLRELRKQRGLSQERLGDASSLSGKFIGEDRRPELCGKVKGLVEIATPHLGPADYTGLISALGLKGADIVEEMRARSKSLETLQDDWNRLPQAERPATVCFSGRGGESALFQCDAFEYFQEGGHTELVKPKDAGDDRYALPIHDVKAAFDR